MNSSGGDISVNIVQFTFLHEVVWLWRRYICYQCKVCISFQLSLNPIPILFLITSVSVHVILCSGSTLSVIAQIDLLVAVLMSGFVAIVYTMLGSMISVAYTDVVQMIFILLGLVSRIGVDSICCCSFYPYFHIHN